MSVVSGSMLRPVTVAMAMLAVVLFGWLSLGRLTVNLLPDLAYPTLTIRTEFEGAAPAEVEEQITRRIEERVGVVSGGRRMHSISTTGQSDVILEFAWGTDMDLAAIEVREKLDLVRLPLDLERPVLLRLNPNLDPIMRLALTRTASGGDDVQALQNLRRFAEEYLKRRLEPVPGVAAVTISGGYEDEIQVLMDQDRLAQVGLTVQQLAQRLRGANVNLSGGRLKDGGQEYLVRTLNEFQTVDDIANTILVQRGGFALRVKDVAQVVQSYKERQSITRVDGREAIELSLYKEGDSNTVDVAREVAKALAKIDLDLPDDYQLTAIYDQSVFISNAVDEVRSAALQGALLAVLVLFLFLRELRPTLIVAATIPISVMATFALMRGYGISLNVMSLGGIALAVGMLMDNAIVVLENIDRHRSEGVSAWHAVRLGAGEVMGAVVASTLTTVAVFLPLAFVEGVAGELFRDQALTVTFALLASLTLAFTLIPMLASIGVPHVSSPASGTLLHSALSATGEQHEVTASAAAVLEQPANGAPVTLANVLLALPFALGKVVQVTRRMAGYAVQPLLTGFDVGYAALARIYGSLLAMALRQRMLTLLVSLAVLLGTLPMLRLLPMELIPALAQGEFKAALTFSPGTRLEHTDERLRQAAEQTLAIAGVTRTWSIAGTGGRLDASAAVGGENVGEINVVMSSDVGQDQENGAMVQLRRWLNGVPDVEFTLERPQLFTFATPLEVEISGNELTEIAQVANALLVRMAADDRFAEVESSLRDGYPEVQIRFDQQRASALGLSVPDIAERVVQKVRGDVPTEYTWRDRKVDIRVRDSEDARDSVADIGNLVLNPESDAPIHLSSVADIQLGLGPADIQRISQQRVAVISADVVGDDLAAAALAIKDMLRDIPHPGGVTSRVAGQNEEMEASFASLEFALALAVVLVYLVMASLFESLLHPFVIMLTIPLAAVGAVWALVLTGTSVSVVVFIGAILLAGIVVNNAIVLIDRVNGLRAEGMSKQPALLAAARQRLRPILMTTLTTVLGLLPMALGLGNAGELRTPMAVTVIGGLLVSTLLTLVVIPVVYSLLDRSADGSAAAIAAVADTEPTPATPGSD